MKKVLIALGFVCAFVGGMFINEYVFANEVEEPEIMKKFREYEQLDKDDMTSLELFWHRYNYETMFKDLYNECE